MCIRDSYYGERWPCVHHARMRIGCSKLRKDLHYNLHVADSSACQCGAPVEDAKHYLLYCPRYTDICVEMRQEIGDLMPITTRNLLFGNKHAKIESNYQVFAAVHKFIIKSGRFD